MAGNALMQIGEVAERTGLSLRTIRYYEEVGLVVPSTRSQGGFRLYTEEDVDRLQVIKRMKPLDFSLDQMRELLEIVDRLGSGARLPKAERTRLLNTLLEHRAAVRARCAALRKQLKIAQEFARTLSVQIDDLEGASHSASPARH
jgi:DNA-binding transcriptional MerR regulator